MAKVQIHVVECLEKTSSLSILPSVSRISVFLITGIKYPERPIKAAHIPHIKIIIAIPYPVLLPKIGANIDHNIVLFFMAGSNILSAKNPANNGERGLENQAIKRLAENTRP